eukprot:TRINITY_DN8039_c0_g1_i1.p1 TRINITY_DN8039_c0_g1~~TRINITY_DN8039_c0_g1_i1.p1  ORF type:complete len:993 (+),score=221.18 TRINITY_DN8039_c0_g1_i1:111-3089(+)
MSGLRMLVTAAVSAALWGRAAAGCSPAQDGFMTSWVPVEGTAIDKLWWTYTAPQGVRIAATADNEVTYFASSDESAASQLYAIRLADGLCLWNEGTGSAGVRTPVTIKPFGGYRAGLVVSVAGNSPCVARVHDASTGDAIWTWNDHRSSNAPLSGAAIASYPDSHVIFVVSALNFTISALEIGTERTLWQASLAENTADPLWGWLGDLLDPVFDAASDCVIALSNKDSLGSPPRGILAVFDARSGNPKWKANVYVTTSPKVVDGVLLATERLDTENAGRLAAYNITTGELLWTKNTCDAPSGVDVFRDGTGRVVYSVSALQPVVGAQPGVYMLSGVHRELEGIYADTDASGGVLLEQQNVLGPEAQIVYLGKDFTTAQGCQGACHDQYSNTSAFIYKEAQHECYCRLDGGWELSDRKGFTSGVWRAPREVWSYSTPVRWSPPVVGKHGEVYFTSVTADGQGYPTQALVALKNGTELWNHSVSIKDGSHTQFMPFSPPAVSTDQRFVVFPALNSTVFTYLVEALPPPSPAPPPSYPAWYQSTVCKVLLSTAGVIFVLLAACLYLRKRHAKKNKIDSPARKFDVVSKLGSGSYGIVYLVRRRTDKILCALKYLSCDDEDQQERALLEFKTMRTFQGHPNMIRVMETFMNWKSESEERVPLIPPTQSSAELPPEGVRPEDIHKFSHPRYVCLVMPFYRNGDLKNFALSSPDFLPEALLLDYTAQMCSLLQYLHDRSHALVHRDLKPENILISDDAKSCVVSDFGLAKKLFTQYCATRAGTLCYMAPECWAHHYGREADIWAIGCILYSVATKRMEEHNIRVMFSEALQMAGTLCYMAPECWAHHYGREADIWAIGCILYSVATKRMEEHNIRVMFSEALQMDNFQEVVAEELLAFGYPTLSCLVSNLLVPDYHFRPSAGDVLDWLGVPHFDPAFPQMPQRRAEAEIRIPPLIVKPAQRKKSRKTGSDRTDSPLTSPSLSTNNHISMETGSTPGVG